jgi:hypothetical protein
MCDYQKIKVDTINVALERGDPTPADETGRK